MNPLILVTLLAAGAAAYGYGQQEPISVRVESSSSSYSAPAQRQDSYSAPQRQDSYSAPQRQESSYGYASMPSRQQIPILRFSQDIRGSEANSVDFETGNGIRSTFNTNVVRGRPSSYQDESGRMVQTDSSVEMSGHSYHQADNGQHIALTWTADDNGFRATGDHLPQPVQMPAEHAEAHRQALARDQSSGYDSGSYQSSSSSYSAPQQQVRSGY